MTLDEMKKDRVAVLEMYLEQRGTLKDSLYRMLKAAAEVRVGHEEFKTLSEALKLMDNNPWSLKRELDELKGK